MDTTTISPLRAYRHERGLSQDTLAATLGINKSTLSRWEDRQLVPVVRVLDVERVTGISRYQLRPDIYGPPPVTTDAGGSARP